mmetsp:Transcript_35784/g.78166  ORF Transcript_35784/g.78166 Transcript_35784/m.78166 type:complete len:112 (-) Transcript_35784:201-536(-)
MALAAALKCGAIIIDSVHLRLSSVLRRSEWLCLALCGVVCLLPVVLAFSAFIPAMDEPAVTSVVEPVWDSEATTAIRTVSSSPWAAMLRALAVVFIVLACSSLRPTAKKST